MSVWQMIERWADAIFYRRPLRRHRGLEHHHLNTMYTYLRFLAIPYLLLPWVFLAVWYVAVIQGCGCYATRPYVEAFCLQTHSSLVNGTPWYLDLWNAGNAFSSITPSHYMETVMASHLAIKDAGIALRQQVSELKDISSNTIKTDERFSSLGMSRVLAISIQILYTPAYYPAPDQVIDMVSDLGPQLDAVSLEFCLEKDITTYTFRTFVDAYAMTTTFSDYEDLTLRSILIFPAIHLMRFISQQSLRRWLTEPKLYGFQGRAEIQFRKEQLIYELKAALDRIDAIFPATQSFQNSSSQSRYLEIAIDKVAIHQQRIRELIDGSDSSFWQWIRESEETAKLERYYRLGERVRGRLFAVSETVDEYEAYCSRLRGHLEFFRQTFESLPLVRLSARSSIAIRNLYSCK